MRVAVSSSRDVLIMDENSVQSTVQALVHLMAVTNEMSRYLSLIAVLFLQNAVEVAGPAERTVYYFTRTARKLRAKFPKGTLTLSDSILNLVKKNELDAVETKSTSVDIHNLLSSREQLSLTWRHMTSSPPQKKPAIHNGVAHLHHHVRFHAPLQIHFRCHMPL